MTHHEKHLFKGVLVNFYCLLTLYVKYFDFYVYRDRLSGYEPQHLAISGRQHANRENRGEINKLSSPAAGVPGLSFHYKVTEAVMSLWIATASRFATVWLPRILGKSDALRDCPDVNGGAHGSGHVA